MESLTTLFYLLPTLVAVGVTLRRVNRARKPMHAVLIAIVCTPLVAALVAALMGGIIGALFGSQQPNDWFWGGARDAGPLGHAVLMGMIFAMVHGGISFWVGCILGIICGLRVARREQDSSTP